MCLVCRKSHQLVRTIQQVFHVEAEPLILQLLDRAFGWAEALSRARELEAGRSTVELQPVQPTESAQAEQSRKGQRVRRQPGTTSLHQPRHTVQRPHGEGPKPLSHQPRRHLGRQHPNLRRGKPVQPNPEPDSFASKGELPNPDPKDTTAKASARKPPVANPPP